MTVVDVVEVHTDPISVVQVRTDPISVVEVIAGGPPGSPGIPGPPGRDGIDLGAGLGNYTHVQGAPVDVWVIDHQLGFVPSVRVTDSGGSQVEGDIVEATTTSLTVAFTGAFSGTAYLS